jgi:hypothetical protein
MTLPRLEREIEGREGKSIGDILRLIIELEYEHAYVNGPGNPHSPLSVMGEAAKNFKPKKEVK